MEHRGKQQIQWQLELHGNKLSKTERALLVLVMDGNFTIGDVARITHIPAMKIKDRVNKAVDKLW